MKPGKFSEEIVAVPEPQRKGDPVLFDKDKNPRTDTSFEKLGRLKTFLGGVCTSGNSSTENDGAAAVIVTSAQKAAEMGLESMAEIKSCAVVGDDPHKTYRTVPTAVDKALAAGWGLRPFLKKQIDIHRRGAKDAEEVIFYICR